MNDHTGQLWLSCFDDVGRIIMGKSADELMALKDENFEAFTREFENANCRKLSFRCRAKMDTFGDNQRYEFPETTRSVNIGYNHSCEHQS